MLDAGPETLAAVVAAGMIMEVDAAMESFTSKVKEELPALEVLPLTVGPDHARRDLQTALGRGSARDFPADAASFNGSAARDEEFHSGTLALGQPAESAADLARGSRHPRPGSSPVKP